MSQDIDPSLLELLRCPLTHSRLRHEGDFLIAEVGGLAYPVSDHADRGGEAAGGGGVAGGVEEAAEFADMRHIFRFP
jgi:hypothetical protein